MQPNGHGCKFLLLQVGGIVEGECPKMTLLLRRASKKGAKVTISDFVILGEVGSSKKEKRSHSYLNIGVRSKTEVIFGQAPTVFNMYLATKN